MHLTASVTNPAQSDDLVETVVSDSDSTMVIW